MRVGRMGEASLIRLIQRNVGRHGPLRLGIGDDACLLADGTALTTDAYAEGVHFDLAYMTHYDVGCRCACAALSDVIAMAAEPEALLVSLCLPRQTTDRAVRDLYRGIESVCRRLGCAVAGGDIIALDRLVLALTAAGRARSPRLRSAARPGDTLYVTGYCGLAETGRLLLAGNVGRQKPDVKCRVSARQRAIARHLCPMPRIAAMRALRPGIHALIDTSDGIATDARHLAEESRVAITLDSSLIPVAPATLRLCRERGLEPVRFALGSGEDYELLFTSPRRIPARAGGTTVTAIGRVMRGRGLFLRDNLGTRTVVTRGYDHLSST